MIYYSFFFLIKINNFFPTCILGLLITNEKCPPDIWPNDALSILHPIGCGFDPPSPHCHIYYVYLLYSKIFFFFRLKKK